MNRKLLAQQLLAERVLQLKSKKDHAELQRLFAAIDEKNFGEDGGRRTKSLNTNVGPTFIDRHGNERNLQIRVSPTLFNLPASRDGVQGIVPGKGGAFDSLGNVPRMAEVNFGWTSPGSPGMHYNQPSDPVMRRQIADVQPSMKSLIADGTTELLDAAGLRAGDIVAGTPYSYPYDMSRAKAYMRQGYGTPESKHFTQYGQIQTDGSLAPVQFYAADPRIMDKLGWAMRESLQLRFAQAVKESADKAKGIIQPNSDVPF